MPEPTPKNFSTQLGVHLEEVREMVQEINPLNPVAADILQNLDVALHQAATFFKQNEHMAAVKNRGLYLDALCDQIVTAVGCAHMSRLNIVGAMGAVNESNLSKFDEFGQPIFDENMKVMKGPNYHKADLTPFV